MERLIENMRKNPCLWNSEIEEYKLNDVKDAAWREVVKECDLPDVKEAKTLWRKLRDGHRQAIARKKLMTGQAVSPKSIWKYERQMEFLLPTMKNRQRSTNAERRPNSLDHQQNIDETPQNEDSEFPDQNCEIYNLPKRGSQLERERKKREVRSAQSDARRQRIVSDDPRPSSQYDALEIFFKSMLYTTSQLPERLQLRVQRQIFNNVMEAKDESLASQPSTSSES